MTRQELLAIAKPILFNTEMVMAILDDRKSVTRRVIKPQPTWFDCGIGDILYVRETFFRDECTADCAGQSDENECPFNHVGNSCYGYKTQYIDSTGTIKWQPSIHMPKSAARIFLRVTGVRVERLQDITEEQAIKEGCSQPTEYCKRAESPCKCEYQKLWDIITPKKDLECYGWNANPWVWVIEFERVKVDE